MGVIGKTELFACAQHSEVIDKLKFITMTEQEFRQAQIRERQSAKGK